MPRSLLARQPALRPRITGVPSGPVAAEEPATGPVAGTEAPHARATRAFLALATVSVPVLAFVPGVPGFAEARPIDLFGPAFWAIALSVGGRPLARLLGLLTIPATATALAAVVIYDPAIVAEQMLRLVRLILIFGPLAAALAVPLRRSHAVRLLWWLAGWTAFSCLLAVLLYLRGDQRTYAHQTFLDGTERFNRLGGWVGESGAYGAVAIVASFAIALALAGMKWRLLGYLVAALFLLVNYDLSLSRVCLLALGVLLAACLYGERRRVHSWLPALLLLPVGGLLAWEATGGPSISTAALGRLNSTGGGSDLTSGRVANWTELLAFDRPETLFIGFGYRGSLAETGTNTENVVVGSLVDFGLLLGPVFLFLLARLWWSMGRTVLRNHDEAQGAVFAGLLAAVMLQWMFNDVAAYFQAFPLFSLLMACGLALGRCGPQDLAVSEASKPAALRPRVTGVPQSA